MPAFDEARIDELKPMARRYDVPVEQDFVLSVLPNGIKTWAFVFDRHGRKQRKTIGVYPDMSRAAAEQALEKLRRREKTFAESGHMRAARPRVAAAGPALNRRIRMLAGACLAIVVAAVLGLAFIGPDEPPDDQLAGIAPEPSLGAPSLPESPSALAREEDAADKNAAHAGEERAATSAPVPVEPPASVTSLAARIAAPEENSGVADSASMPAANLPPSPGVGADVAQAAISAATREIPASTRNVLPANSEPVAEAAERPVDAAPAERTPSPERTDSVVAPAPSGTPARQPLPEMPAPADPAAPEPATLAVTQGRVARARLASAIVDREPVGRLGPVVTGRPGADTSVFFFTELRSLSGQTVTHQWFYEGAMITEINFAIGESWRWRVYSRKDISPESTGLWEVFVIGPEGETLLSTEFRFELAGTVAAEL